MDPVTGFEVNIRLPDEMAENVIEDKKQKLQIISPGLIQRQNTDMISEIIGAIQ